MPPRYAYWTIIVDDQPTAFRSGSQEDLMPTFKRLQQRNASAKMMWWQNGKLWDSRLDAQEAMRARGEMGRRGDERQTGGFRDRERAPRSTERRPSARDQRSPSGKLAWKPKGEGEERPRRPEWSPKSQASTFARLRYGGQVPVPRKAGVETQVIRCQAEGRLEASRIWLGRGEAGMDPQVSSAGWQAPRKTRMATERSGFRVEVTPKVPRPKPQVPGKAQMGAQRGIQEVAGHRGEARQELASGRRAQGSASEIQGRQEGEVGTLQADHS